MFWIMWGLIISILIMLALIDIGIVASVMLTTDLNHKIVAAQESGIEVGCIQGYATGFRQGSVAGYQKGSQIGYAASRRETATDHTEAGFYFTYNPTYDEVPKLLVETDQASAWHIHDSAGANGIRAAYDAGYTNSYTQAYDKTYHTAYLEAYAKGYDKEYAMGRQADATERVASRVARRNPPYHELKEFLVRDKTDTKLYLPDKYVSFDFAIELNNNAECAGIRAAVVIIIFPKKSHGIAAFETTDRGLIFIEPQSDAEVAVVKGKSYWHSANGMTLTSYDDTIVDVQILW